MLVKLYLEGDSIQREKAVEKVCKEVYGGQDVERVVFRADQGQTGRAIEEICSYSLFAENRVVILTGIDAAFKAKRGGGDDGEESLTADPSSLIQCISNPRGETPFLLFSESKSVPKKILDALGKERTELLAKTPESQIRQAVVRRCEKAKISMKPDALKFFMENCGADAETALHEIQKIVLWANEGQEVAVDDVRRLVCTEKEEIIWSLTDAVKDRQPERALAALKRLMEQGQEAIPAIGLLASQFRNLYLCKTLQSENIPKSDWSKYTSQRGWALDNSVKQSQGLAEAQLRSAIALFRQADIDIKGGKSDSTLVIERLVLDLCRI